MSRLYVVLGLVALLLVPASAFAVPVIDSKSDTTDDATVTLRTMVETIEDDVRSFCEITIVDTGSAKSFTAGDVIYLWVYEDDGVINDEIWKTNFTVSPAEVSANSVNRTFNCSSPFGTDGIGDLEIFGEARVEKDSCGFGCVWDRPATNNIDVVEVFDDSAEEDDTNGMAPVAGLGTTRDRVNRDQDWFEFTLTTPANVTADALHIPDVGRMDIVLLDDMQNPVMGAMATDMGDRTQLYAPSMVAGTYYLRVSPRVSNDFAFYDFSFAIDNLSVTCTPTNTENRPCGNCGTEERTCQSNGQWGMWGMCSGEGECAVGAMETQGCGDSGEQSRVCEMTCTWSQWDMCVVPPCMEGTMQACFTGSTEERGVGACTDGTISCTGGLWGMCENEVLGSVEVCDDMVDNDCDGATDDADDDCTVPTGVLGAPCASDNDCDTMWSCVQPPEHARFRGGYCGEQRSCNGISFECGPNSACGEVGADEYCLAGCTSDADCRQDYVCKPFSGGGGCTPRCLNDDDCAASDVCNRTTGLCEMGVSPMDPGADMSTGTDTSTDMGMGDVTDAGEDTGEKLKADAGCACATVKKTDDSPLLPTLMLLGVGLVWGLRRRI